MLFGKCLLSAVGLALAVSPHVCTGAPAEAEVAAALAERILPNAAAESSYTAIFEEVAAADRAADAHWACVRTREEYDARRAEMKRRMIEAIGGFPEKTPLNAKVVGTVRRKGYAVDKVIFESMPGLYVTGHFFRPEGQGPHPTVVVSCGHSKDGKNCATYQRACVQLVKRGLAAFIYDPVEQGDRLVVPGYFCCTGHNAIGVRAMLLGWSMARFRIWDGVRAIDYVLSREDVKKDSIGFQGQSGGGTMTALMMAVDDRICAAAPSCYLTNMRELALHCGPQDAEQNVFGQLSFGLNHAGYVLMQDIPVMMVCKKNDFFPYSGTCATYELVAGLAERLGMGGRYLKFAQPGPHGWVESTREASAIWMKRWLAGGKDLPDPAALQVLDLGPDVEKSGDCGLSAKEAPVPQAGQVADMPGFRSPYAILRERLVACEKTRKDLSAEEKTALVRKLAKVRLAKDARVRVRELPDAVVTNGMTVKKMAFLYPNQLALPAVLFVPQEVRGAPALVVGDDGRAKLAGKVAKLVSEGRPVMALDYTGAGEIAAMKHPFYESKASDEELAHLLYWLGDSLVGRRATDILVAADWLADREADVRPELFAEGAAVIPAAHARAADPAAFSGVTTDRVPASWAEIVRNEEQYDFLNCVNGALVHYDWPDLLR